VEADASEDEVGDLVARRRTTVGGWRREEDDAGPTMVGMQQRERIP
jgi:hypothetical protein